MLFLLLLFLLALFRIVPAATIDRPHPHSGIIGAYDGKIVLMNLTAEQQTLLESGKAVRDDYSANDTLFPYTVFLFPLLIGNVQ